MLAIKKPRNARSKRALDKRQPQLNEGIKTALIVNASHSSALVSKAIHQLSTLKKPHAIPFTKKKSNDVNPFIDNGSIEFWSAKNDTPLMLVGDSRKKRKDNLTWIRLFDGRVLDMLEMGIDSMKGVEEFKAPTLPDIGSRPLFHFGGPQFSADAAALYPAHAHMKSLLLDFYRGEEVLENGIPTGGSVALQNGLQFVISVVAGPVDEQTGGSGSTSTGQGTSLADLYAAGAASSSSSGIGSSSSPSIDTSASGAKLYFRTYSLIVPAKTPARAVPDTFQLHECGPAFDFTLRRRQAADPTLLSHSLKRGKTQAEKNRQGKSDTYKKNIDTDEMGDMVGRIHVGKQDLANLQTRKMKGLKAGQDDDQEGDSDEDDDDDDGHDGLSDDEEDAYMGLRGDDDSDGVEGEEDDEDEEDEELEMEGLTAPSSGEDQSDDDEQRTRDVGKSASNGTKRVRKA